MKKSDADLLRRAAEIVQWSVDVPPMVRDSQLAEAAAIKEALDRAIARCDGGWIPVGTRLPDDDETVQIALGPKESEPVWLGYHDADGWHSVEGVECVVTAWQPMLEPPK